MTPNYIEVLLHYYTTPVAHPRWRCSAVQGALNYFKNEGIIAPEAKTESGYAVTPRGQMLVLMLCGTPLPELVWVDPRKP